MALEAWCEHGSWERYCAIRSFVYVRCLTCGLVRLDPLPTDEEAQSYYTADYFTGGLPDAYPDYQAEEAVHRENAASRLKLLAQGRPPGRLLDVGCAFGYALDVARRDGWEVAGIEPSEFAQRAAVREFGLAVHRSMSDLPHGERQFDAAMAIQVLEHSAVPRALLLDIAQVLEPGGVLLIETWDASSTVARVAGCHWLQLAPPSVLWVFSRESLPQLLESTGFRVQSIAKVKKIVTVGHVLALVADRYPVVLGSIARRLRNLEWLASIRIRYGLGDLITVLAIRT